MPYRPLPGSTGGSPRTPAPFQPAPGSTGGIPLTPAALVDWCLQKVFGEEGKTRVAGTTFTPLQIPRRPQPPPLLSCPAARRATPPLEGMPSQPLPGSTSGSPRTSAPFQPAPGSAGGIPRAPAELSGLAVSHKARKCATLISWVLDRVEGEEGKIRVAGDTFTPQMSPQMRKGASSSKGNRARRMFTSKTIVKRHNYLTIEDEEGHLIRIGGLIDIPNSLKNGFSEEVCECFESGFPILWQSLVNPKMVQDNEHAQSPAETATSAPGPSVQDYMAKFLSPGFSSSFRYDVTENGCSGNTYGLTTQSLSNLADDNAGNIGVSWGLYGLRMDVPEKPLAPPGEACNSGQENYQHESTQIDASKQDMVNRSISSVSVKQSTCSISSNSKVDGNISAPSKISSVVNEGHRSIVGCVQAGDDTDIPQENMQSCSGEHGMVTLPIHCTSSQVGEPEITDALEVPAIGGSEDSMCKRLRSGKVLGMPSGGPMKKGHKQKKIQQEASSKQMVNQGATSTADLTSHENDFSAAEVVEEKMEPHDSCRRGRGRPPKAKGKGKRKRENAGKGGKGKRKRENAYLFSNWV